jgi:hypothetical protein
MLEKLRIAALVAIFILGNAVFFFYMQAHPTECDNYGYPVCTGDPQP